MQGLKTLKHNSNASNDRKGKKKEHQVIMTKRVLSILVTQANVFCFFLFLKNRDHDDRSSQQGERSVLIRRGISKRKRRKVRLLSSVETMHGDNETGAREKYEAYTR